MRQNKSRAQSAPATSDIPPFRRPDARNNFPDLVELRAYLQPPNDPNASVALKVELRVFKGTLSAADRAFQVSLAALTLAVSHSGFDPAPGARFGEPTLQNDIERKHSTTVTHHSAGTMVGKLAAGLGLTGPKADISVSTDVTKSGKVDEKVTFSETTTTSRVTARPNLRWEVREPENRVLNASYLAGETLCSLIARPGANQLGVSVEARVKQKDIRFEHDARPSIPIFRSDNTREKLLCIFLAKAISHDPQYAGTVTLSQVDIQSDEQ